MEGDTGVEQSLLVRELTHSQELLGQLLANLDQPIGIDLCKPLASEVLLSIVRALCIAKSNDTQSPRQTPCSFGGTDSSTSPHSEDSGKVSKERERREVSKKRKTLPKWTQQVIARTPEGLEGPVDDGYSWRKYGQKDILGAKHPRGYYRCTHRGSRGCLATKQVQRSDQSPMVLDISYRGDHTCRQKQELVSFNEKKEQKQSQDIHTPVHQVQLQRQQPDLLLSFQTDLRVRTEVSSLEHENVVFSSPSTLENCFNSSFSPSFISSANSESNFYGMEATPHSAESSYKDIMTATSSASGSPLIDMDFMLCFDPDFPFDTSTFFT